MEKALFVIVHESCIKLDISLYKEGKDPGLTRQEDYEPVCHELERIRAEEFFIELDGDPTKVEYLVPMDVRQIWVCGAYGDICVTAHVNALRKQLPKTPIDIHPQGTISFVF